MKLLLVVNSIHPGGAENFSFYLIKYLKKNYGYNVDIAYVRNVESSAGDYNHKELAADFRIFWLGKKPDSGIKGLYSSYRSLKKLVSDNHYDVILSTCELPDLLNAIVKSKAVKVTNLQNAIPWAHMPFFGRLLERFFVNPRMDKYVAVSESVKNIWTEKYGVREEAVTVIPNGVHDIFYTVNKVRTRGTGMLKLGVVARLEPQKGHLYLLRAINELKGKLPLELRIVGKGSMEGEMREFINAHGIGNMVKFLGWHNREEVLEFYKSVDVLVMASLFEGLPLNGIEAMATGLPVIGSRVPGIVDFLNEDNGLLFESKNYVELASCIMTLANNPDLYAKLSQRSIDASQHFRFSAISQQYHALFSRILNK